MMRSISSRLSLLTALTCSVALGGCGQAADSPQTAPLVASPPTSDAERNHGSNDEQTAALLRACPAAAQMTTRSAEVCTQIGCLSGFFLSVSPHEAWPHGLYRFEITRDGEAIHCEGRLPLKPCGEPSMVCDGDGVRIVESGCALDASAHAFGDISFEGFPKQVEVEVQRDGTRIAHATFAPAYQASQPNGPGCEPICCGASGDLTLPFAP